MIDYLKSLILDPDIDRLLSNQQLDFKREISDSTGEVSTKTVSQYHHCKITIYDSGTVLFTGSIHKMYNSLTGVLAPNYGKNKEYKGFNGNQFYYHEIEFIKQHLLGLFGVPLENMIIQNIEYGLNLSTSFDSQNFIRGLLLFEMKTFEYKYNEHFAQSIHDQYILKIYNKGNQYNMALHTLRVEMKVTRMDHQKKAVGINSMEDINPLSINRAFKYLYKQIKKVLYLDTTIDRSKLTPRQKMKLKDYRYPRYWIDLTYKQRCVSKKSLNKIINLNSKNLRLELLTLIEQNRVEFDRHSENHKRVEFDCSNIVSDSAPLPQRICPVTGINISMQKPTSTMLSNTGLKHLEKNNPKLFLWLKRKLLTGRKNKFEKDIYTMMSKQIRNRKNNRPPRNNNQLSIF